jgi:MFS family permease
VPRGHSTITQVWPAGSPRAEAAPTPRDDLLREARDTGTGGDGTFSQAHGPFRHYRRTLTTLDDGSVQETVEYRLHVPGWGWLFRYPIGRAVRTPRQPGANSPWWAPPDQLTARQAAALALLATAAMSSAFANTIFTQTATFAADSFGISDKGLGWAGAVVRVGVVIALPFAVLADRLGRRRTIVLLAWLTPICCSLGAIAPSFWMLTATQTVARPLGIALSMLAGVAAAEDMPKNSRAYALSVLAMAAGLGAGVAVAALRLTDLGAQGWRLVYVLSLLWLPVAVSLGRNLDETRRFETVHRISPRMNRRRLGLIALVALTSNLFIAPVSYFQNNYLDKVRGYSGGGIALFTLITATPASIGLILGGRWADVGGRRRVIAICTPISTALVVALYFSSGAAMWGMALAGGIIAAMSYPAFAVYRAEMFPTGNRSWANGLVTTVSLLSGSLGILLVGLLRDHGARYGTVMAVLAIGQLASALLAYRYYPESAHLELEQLNPEDPLVSERD